MTGRPATPSPAEIERLLFYWPHVIGKASNDWAKGFAKSIAKQSRRRGWQPSAKQAALMRRMVAQVFNEEEDVQLLE